MEQALKEQDQNTQVVNYDITDAALAEIKLKYANAQLTNPKEYKEVIASIGEVRGLRVKVEKHRKGLKADSLAWGRLVDSEAKLITAVLVEIEAPLKKLKQADDDRKAKEVAEKERIAKEHITKLKNKVLINFGVARLDGLSELSVVEIHELISESELTEIGEEYEDFQEDAFIDRDILVSELKRGLFRRTKQDEEDMARAEEDHELAARKKAWQEDEDKRKKKHAAREEADRVAREKSDREQLLNLMASAVHVEEFDGLIMDTLITIGRGMFWSGGFSDAAIDLAGRIQEEIENEMDKSIK